MIEAEFLVARLTSELRGIATPLNKLSTLRAVAKLLILRLAQILVVEGKLFRGEHSTEGRHVKVSRASFGKADDVDRVRFQLGFQIAVHTILACRVSTLATVVNCITTLIHAHQTGGWCVLFGGSKVIHGDDFEGSVHGAEYTNGMRDGKWHCTQYGSVL